MTTLYLEWGGDLKLSTNGGLELANGWDEVRQRIFRRILTNPAFTLADGTPIAADYIFHPDYGLGAGRLIGEPISDDWSLRLKHIITEGVTIDQGVDASEPPVIDIRRYPGGVVWVIIVVRLKTGEPGRIAFALKSGQSETA